MTIDFLSSKDRRCRHPFVPAIPVHQVVENVSFRSHERQSRVLLPLISGGYSEHVPVGVDVAVLHDATVGVASGAMHQKCAPAARFCAKFFPPSGVLVEPKAMLLAASVVKIGRQVFADELAVAGVECFEARLLDELERTNRLRTCFATAGFVDRVEAVCPQLSSFASLSSSLR